MQVGNLVKVYHFSHDARQKLNYGNIDAHYVGLVVASSDPDPKHRRVLRCVDGEWEDYHLNRLEVIA